MKVIPQAQGAKRAGGKLQIFEWTPTPNNHTDMFYWYAALTNSVETPPLENGILGYFGVSKTTGEVVDVNSETPSVESAALLNAQKQVRAKHCISDQLVAINRNGEPPVHPNMPRIHTLSADQRTHVLDGNFSIERQVDGLPDNLKTAFSIMSGGGDFKMANPGEKYQETDEVFDDTLPFRRLLFAGISNDKYFVYYEEGGYSPGCHVAVFEVDSDKKAKFVWVGFGPHTKDLMQLRSMIAAGKFMDEPAYSSDWQR